MKKLIWTILYFLQQKICETLKNIWPLFVFIGLGILVIASITVKMAYPMAFFWCAEIPILLFIFFIVGVAAFAFTFIFAEWIKDNWDKAKKRAENRL